MDGNEVCAGWEGAFNHQLAERGDNRGLYMATTEHRRANGHEVGDRVVSIADKLYAFSMRLGMRAKSEVVLPGGCSRSKPDSISSIHVIACWTHGSFSMVQLHAPCQSTLRKESELRYDELVKLSRDGQQGPHASM